MSLRLAFWTPLPPLHNGIADYSVELLSYLSGRYDIEVFIDKGYEPASWLSERYKIFRYSTFEAHHQKPFDLIIYQLGGSHNHHYMFDAIQRWRGLVVLHDLYMGLSLYRYYAQHAATNQRFIRYLGQEEGAQIEKEFKHLLRLRGAAHDTAVNKFFDSHYLLNWVVNSSLGQIVHMNYAAQELSRQCPKAQPHVINMGVQKPDLSMTPEALRARFGLDPSTFVIGVFGKINKYKGHQICLEAVQQLRREYSNILVVIVGPHIQSDYFDQLRLMVDANGMQGHVHFAGYLDQTQFDRVLLICDVVVNLRYPGQMQMSATLIRALAAAKPVIISDIPEWEALPDAACLRLQHGVSDVETLKELLKRLIVDPKLRESLSLNAQRYIEENATLDIMGRQYEHIIGQVTHDRTAPSPATIHAPEITPSVEESPLSPTHNELPLVPVEQVSQREMHHLLQDWHRLQTTTAPTTVIRRVPKFIEFVLNAARRVRYLGSAWQIQGSLYEAMTQRQEVLVRKIDYLTEQSIALKAELNQLRAELNATRSRDNDGNTR